MVKKKLEELNLLDKFLFDEAMEDKETYQTTVSILLENEVELLKPGSKDFNSLNGSCFILIAPFDIFGRGLYRYTFEGVCRECPDLKLEWYAEGLYQYEGEEPGGFFGGVPGCFMEYMGKTTDETAGNIGSQRIREIHEKVKRIKRSEKVGLRLMQKWEELAYERDEGKAEGIIETALEYGALEEEILKKLQDKLKISQEKAGEYLKSYMEKKALLAD